MKKFFVFSAALLILMIVLTGCGTLNPPATVVVTAPEVETTSTVDVSSTLEPTATLDPCIMPQLEKEVQKVHNHMREFDDASALAGSIPREQLSTSIADLQRIRREAQDEEIPACLAKLKEIEVQHMNTVIETLLAFLRGTDQQTLDQGITLARQQHDQYLLEYARLAGITVVPATFPPAGTETPTPTP
jgi:PBP1b-binding outer membrane lipoprotein LpoB